MRWRLFSVKRWLRTNGGDVVSPTRRALSTAETNRLRRIIEEIEKYSQALRRLLFDHNTRFHFIVGYSILDHPQFASLALGPPPVGWESVENSWSKTFATYLFDSNPTGISYKHIFIAINAIKRIPRWHFFNGVRHEVAHALDDCLGVASNDSIWEWAWKLSVRRMPHHPELFTMEAIAYFAQSKREFFAGFTSRCYESPRVKEVMQSIFPEAVDFLRLSIKTMKGLEG